MKLIALAACLTLTFSVQAQRARDKGIVIGVLPAGAFNAITDVAGVKVQACRISLSCEV